MISYNEACKKVGYDRSSVCPILKHIFFAYKNGECRYFDSCIEAAAWSKLYEKVTVNQDQVDEWTNNSLRLANEAFNTWYNALRNEYIGANGYEGSELNEKLFLLCYQNAVRTSSTPEGFDTVSKQFDKYWNFAYQVLNINETV